MARIQIEIYRTTCRCRVQSTRADQRIICLRGNSPRESRANRSPRYIGWPVIIRNNKLTADRPFPVGIALLDTRWRFSLATANTNSTRALDRLFQLDLLNLSDRTAVQPYALSFSLFLSFLREPIISRGTVVTIEPPRGYSDPWETQGWGKAIDRKVRTWNASANTKRLILYGRNSNYIRWMS